MYDGNISERDTDLISVKLCKYINVYVLSILIEEAELICYATLDFAMQIVKVPPRWQSLQNTIEYT